MSFDSSRFTADPWQNFLGVVMQQGRVQLDSDWNEWLAEFNRRIQAGTLDIVGQAGVPSSTPNGFLITITSVSGNPSVSIGPGRMYVDGILAENHGVPGPNPEKWTPAADATPEPSYPGWDGSLDELVGPKSVDYNSQPFYPNAQAFPKSGGPYLIYLDVWQREVTFLEDPDLIEKAVGVDTTGRIQTVWQVKWLSAPAGATCTTDIPGLDALLLPPGPRLTTGVAQTGQDGACCLTSNSGYTGLENQLYRVEIHQPTSAAAGATFKWSRDNASVATSVTGIDSSGTILTVQSTGKDSVLCFSPNDWVEITDDWLELNNLPGEIQQIKTVTASANTITLYSAVSLTKFPPDANGNTAPARHTRLTRWDQKGQILVAVTNAVWADLTLPGATGDIPVPPAGTTLILENGITLTFNSAASGTPFNSGYYWNFAARSSDGTVEYLDNVPPRGIHHHYARLAVITLPSGWTDCRHVFPPLTGLSQDGCCCCSITVGDGLTSHGDFTDIQSAISSITSGTTAEICILAGAYSPSTTINIAISNLTIRGCDLATINFTGSGPAFQISSASNIVLEDLNVQSSSTTVEVIAGTQISVENCSFTVAAPLAGASVPWVFAIQAQVADLVVASNQLSGGGIWVLDGSSEVEIRDNVITNAVGPGVALGGLPSGINPLNNATGVLLTKIARNQITGATNCGIATALDPGQSPSLSAWGDIEDLLISGNLISNCAQKSPVTPFSASTLAGILLEYALTVSIRDNTIVDNGTAGNLAACGIFGQDVSDLEISGNRIDGNGVNAQSQSTKPQAGIGLVVNHYASTDSLRIQNNTVRMPLGQALVVEGVGPMIITGNIFQTLGLWPPTSTAGVAVEVINAGLPLLFLPISMPPLQMAVSQLNLGTPSGGDPQIGLADGRTIFDNNQVTLIGTLPPNTMIAPCIFISLDDLSLQNNQFEATALTPFGIFVDVFALGVFSLRACGNRFSEFPYTALFSHIGGGWYNNVNMNQATHCVTAFGANPMSGATNQEIIMAFCKESQNILKALGA